MMFRWVADADLVVVGSGVAGLTAALRAQAAGLRVVVLTKGSAADGSTWWAQGGVAVVLAGEHEPGDSVARHTADTITAGAGLCDPDMVATILAAGPGAVARLRQLGACFDRAEHGRLARTREGGHTAFRVVHAGGDATGAEVERALLAATRDRHITVLEQHHAVEVVRSDSGSVAGVAVLGPPDGAPAAASGPSLGILRAPAVLLATGGLGQLYPATSNPEVATGDGLALALRAGAAVADIEFVQFHPTALYLGATAVSGRRPLVTEALRGEGAVLVDATGDRLMAGVHPLADLAPRDIVAAAITSRMHATGTDHVFLDATHLDTDTFQTRFPTVYAACRAVGVNPVVEPIPVAPAAHYLCGGIVVDDHGRTGVPGLYAAGEVARTGLHGANRLASNSLLEGLVMGERVAAAVAAAPCRPERVSGDTADAPVSGSGRPVPIVPDLATLVRVMGRYAAIGRDAEGLAVATGWVAGSSINRVPVTAADHEAAALTLVATAVLVAAAERTESRGCHVRTDFPASDDAVWRRGVVLRLDPAGRPTPVPAERHRPAPAPIVAAAARPFAGHLAAAGAETTIGSDW